ncbi:MAG: MFS transporter [Vulcanimicrobiaceae bacterium]
MFARLLPILGITFIDVLGFSILIPILPYYVEHFHAPKIAVGVLFAIFAFCQFLAGPFWGNVSDRIGRKRVLVISQIGATLGWIMMAFAPTLTWVFIARVVEGISGGNISVTQAYVADRVEPQQRARAFGFIGAAFSSGIIIGPAAGGILLAHFGYAVPFLVAAAMQVVTLALTVAILPESIAQRADVKSGITFGDIRRCLEQAPVAALLGQKFAYALALYGWFASFALALQVLLGFGPSETSYLFGYFGAISVVIQLGVVGRLSERFGARIASNVGIALALGFFVIVGHVHTVLGALGVLVLFAFGLAIANATLTTLLTDLAPDEMRGTVLGVGSSIESIAGIIMPTITTGVLAAYGAVWSASICAVFCALALVLGLRARRSPLAALEAK